jgi:cytosine/adenosine deaminase-related metal-dependent hydrolase
MFTLRARYVFPVSAPPIRGGAVSIEGERIVAVGAEPAGGPVLDLGDAAILPGLVNAHTHLEFSRLEAPLGSPGIGFTDWLELVIDCRRTCPPDVEALRQGANQSAACGTTLLGDIVQSGASYEPFLAGPVRSTVFLELIGPTRQRAEAVLQLAEDFLRGRASRGAESHPPTQKSRFSPPTAANCRRGLSPHAPYSARWELLPKLAALSAEAEVPLAIHLAESPEELEFLATGRGPLREFLERRGAGEPGIVPRGARPLDYLHVLARAYRVLVVHGNYLDEEEIGFAAHRRKMAVVYCPRSHSFFQHQAYRLAEMVQAGVCLALGSDSRASTADLSMLAEMRHAAQAHPHVPPRQILQMATINGACALGWSDLCGSLEPGKLADLVVVALSARRAKDPHELLVDGDLPILAVYRGGREISPTGMRRWPNG